MSDSLLVTACLLQLTAPCTHLHQCQECGSSSKAVPAPAASCIPAMPAWLPVQCLTLCSVIMCSSQEQSRDHRREPSKSKDADVGAAEAEPASKKRRSAFDEAPAAGAPGAGLTPAEIGLPWHLLSHEACTCATELHKLSWPDNEHSYEVADAPCLMGPSWAACISYPHTSARVEAGEEIGNRHVLATQPLQIPPAVSIQSEAHPHLVVKSTSSCIERHCTTWFESR